MTKEIALEVAVKNFIRKVETGVARSVETYNELKNAFDMPTSNYLGQVREFHETFSHPVLEKPTLIDSKRALMRFSLIREELLELEKAYLDGDLVEIADALADLQYVLSGAILEFGLNEKFDTVFNEVHRSNMSKIAQSKEEAERTIAIYADSSNPNYCEAHFEERDGKFFVIRTSDNKTLKAADYSPANIAPILGIE